MIDIVYIVTFSCLYQTHNNRIIVYKANWCSQIRTRYVNGLVQECHNSCAFVIELLQCCAKHSTWSLTWHIFWDLTHWGRVTHICVNNLTIIGSDNGLSPGRRQAIIWTNAVILSIRPQGTYFNEILIRIQTFSFKKMHLKVSSAKWRPFCLNLNVLIMLVAVYLLHRFLVKT